WLPRFSYDCIVTAATLHHVDLKAALRAMARALEPGGTLLVSDLFSRTGWRNLPINAAAWITAQVRQARVPWKLRVAYWRHGRNETYLTLDEVERVARQELPGVELSSRLLWRYGMVWRKP